MQSENLYTLHYFEVHGRGSPMRMLLDHAKVKYEDHQISFGEWPEIKPTMPNQQVPCLELPDGTKMAQTYAILRFLGKRHGYYPTDDFEAQRVDELLDRYMDVMSKVYMPHFAEDKEALYPNIFEKLIPSFLKEIDAACAKGEFICGPKITIADFAVGGLYTNYCANEHITFAKDKFAQILKDFPNFEAYGKRFETECAEHLKNRKPAPI